MSASFYDLRKFAKTGLASPGMTAYDKMRALSMAGGGAIKTLTGVPPLSFTGNGKPLISWSMLGNGQKDGTPAPDNPIMPDFCGVRTANLLPPKNTTTFRGITFTTQRDGTTICNGTADGEITFGWSVPASISGDYYFSGCPTGGSNQTYDVFCYDKTASARTKRWDGTSASLSDFGTTKNNEVKIISGHDTEVRIRFRDGYHAENLIFKMMLREPSAPSEFEPYGWKIPVTSAGQTQNVYLGQVQTVRRVKKLVLTGEEAWRKSTNFPGGFFVPWSSLGGISASPARCTHAYGVPNGQTYVYGTFLSDAINFNIRIMQPGTEKTEWEQFLSDQYVAGTPVVIWYVLATPTTGIVNEPLAKIGTYADELHSTDAGVSIPTVRGSNTLTVDTELQPSIMTITYR